MIRNRLRRNPKRRRRYALPAHSIVRICSPTMNLNSHSRPNLISQMLLLHSTADGTKLVVAAGDYSENYPFAIYTSTNTGASWTSNAAPSLQWTAVASSADGTRLGVRMNLNRQGQGCRFSRIKADGRKKQSWQITWETGFSRFGGRLPAFARYRAGCRAPPTRVGS